MLLNHYISAAVRAISTKFGTLMHFDILDLCRSLKIWNFKNPTWRRPPSWKFEKSRYLGRGSRDFDKIWHSDAVPPAWPFWPLKIEIFENPSCELICIGEFNIDEHLTEQHWQPVFLFSKPSVSIHVCCLYIELSRSKLHKTGDLQVGNWHVNCQHSSSFQTAS